MTAASDPGRTREVTRGTFAPAAQLLSNGRYTALVSDAGGGGSSFRGYALTRWAPDRTQDADGFVVYVRDLESGAYWSAARQPVPRAPEAWGAGFLPGCVELAREDDGVETLTELCVAPDADAELRRITLHNRGARARRLDLTTYAELVLNTAAGDAGHPAFSKLFVQTGWLAERQALLAWRRLRSPEDDPLWAAHWLVADGGVGLAVPEWETDRARFLGRGRTTASPRALDGGVRLSGTVGNVLDPVFSLRRAVDLAPGESVEITSVLAAAGTRGELEALAERFRAPQAIEEAFRRAEERAESALADVGLPDSWIGALPRLTGALMYGHPALRAAYAAASADRPLSALRALGLPAGGPLVVLSVTTADDLEAARGMSAIVTLWRRYGVPAELVIVEDAPAGGDDLYARLGEIAGIAERASSGHTGLSTWIVVRRGGELAAADRALLERAARIVLRGRLPEMFDRGASAADANEVSSARGASVSGMRSAVDDGNAYETDGASAERLTFFNGYGGFSPNGAEYVIRIGEGPPDQTRPPLPWANVVANERAGFIVTESGAGYTWSVNSRINRLTPWLNDPVSDPTGEALYVRDEETGEFWSPTPGPAPAGSAYEVRHGFGYSRYRLTTRDLEHDAWQYVPRHDPLKIVRVRVTNRGDRPRRLSLFAYFQWVLGGTPQETSGFVVTSYDAGARSIFAVNRANEEFAGLVAFASVVAPAAHAVHATADRAEFLGRHGRLAEPAALHDRAPLSGASGAGLDPCAAFAVPVEIPAGETAECVFLLGEAESEEAARALVEQYGTLDTAAGALEEARAFWRGTLSGVRVETPSPELDLMVNGWLAYQDLSCRVWGRSAFYQSGGAFGFRDQLQDSAAFVYLAPELTRAQILLHAAHQFVEGDVLHWWHPPLSKGMRTRFSDDLLWLPYITAFYVGATGDAALLEEAAPFMTARTLEPGEDEVYLVPEVSGESASVYEHCCRALDRSLTAGAHGLPLMGVGDWNDGMNRVGREGRGESVWLGFFLYDILNDFIPICERRGDAERVERYRAYHARLGDALNDGGWDGSWYRRAYYDSGVPLGSAANDECRIDAIAQAWSVLSGAAPPERAAQALDAMEAHLVSEREGLIRLLTPPFDKTPHDPGYIKGYLPGVRENGGQYTHGALWAVRALAEFGRGDRAARLLEMLSPVSHGRTREEVGVYQAEPYVIAADVYGVAPHVGRAGWTWYTGSAGWMYRVAVESILGVTLVDGRALSIRPSIPDDWPGFTLHYRVPGDGGASYEIVVTRAEGAGETRAMVDGDPARVEDGAVLVPLLRDGAAHRVEVALAPGAVPRYTYRAASAARGDPVTGRA
ncbi:MAG: hypothetical protein WKG32_05460 [Gemmatimonadaceae bacterium]